LVNTISFVIDPPDKETSLTVTLSDFSLTLILVILNITSSADTLNVPNILTINNNENKTLDIFLIFSS